MASSPPEGKHNMNLPEFELGEVLVMKYGVNQVHNALICPRKNCRGKFIIQVRYLKKSRFWSRPCPYCFRAAKLPDELLRHVGTEPPSDG